MSITPKDKLMLKDKIVQELRSYIQDEIIPVMQGLDELTGS